MKKLDIGNYENLKDYQIQHWVIYSTHESDKEYNFRLKRIDGDSTHGAVSLGKEINEGKIVMEIMYRSYSNKICVRDIPLSEMKNKEKFWLMIESYIEEQHKLR